MIKSQAGFSALPILALLILLTIIVAAIYIDKSNKPSKSSGQATKSAPELRLVKIDTTNWHVYSPFNNFSFKYPDKWSLEDKGQFKQPFNGSPNEVNSSYVTIHTLQIASDDARVEVLKGNTQEMASDTIKKGAGINLMVTFDRNITTEDLCNYYTNKKLDYFAGTAGKMCQVQLQKNRYTFMLGKGGNVYRTELFFNKNESGQNQEQFVSTARELVKSYSFKN